jgi:1-acyl-sn-glycerol-3-phosphate acyltransferase
MRLRFMGKDSMWNNRFFGWIFSTIGGFPVTRGTADRGALNTALLVLRDGSDPVVAFPEGERKDGPRVHPLFDGAAYMASKAQVPIVPVGIAGTAKAMPRAVKFPRPKKVHLVIGKPMAPPALSDKGRVSRKEIKRVTEELREEIQIVFDQAMERIGTPNIYVPGSEPLPEHMVHDEIVAPRPQPKRDASGAS